MTVTARSDNDTASNMASAWISVGELAGKPYRRILDSRLCSICRLTGDLEERELHCIVDFRPRRGAVLPEAALWEV
jgi:hypothetical protein